MKDIKRRSFIKHTLLAGAGTVLAPQFLNARQTENAQPVQASQALPTSGKKVIIAGAGITGLCCAYELMKAGHDDVLTTKKRLPEWSSLFFALQLISQPCLPYPILRNAYQR